MSCSEVEHHAAVSAVVTCRLSADAMRGAAIAAGADPSSSRDTTNSPALCAQLPATQHRFAHGPPGMLCYVTAACNVSVEVCVIAAACCLRALAFLKILRLRMH